MINIDTHFFLEARHVDFMTTIKERSWFANTTNHDSFRTVSNLLWLLSYLTTLDELRARCHDERRRSIFGAKLTAWRHKICHIFHF